MNTRDEINNLGSELGILRYLPNEFAQLIIDLGKLQEPKKVIDLTCRIGSLLGAFQQDAEIIRGIELDLNKANIAAEQYPLIQITHGNAVTEHITEKYDLVFCIPPFGERIRVDGINLLSELAFMEKALSVLEKDGMLLFHCSHAFLTLNAYEVVRSIILNNYKLEMILTIPPSRDHRTLSNTALLVIRNAPSNENDNVLLLEYQNNRREIVENYLNQSGDFIVAKNRMTHRWDRHFFNPKFEKINELLKDKEVCRLEELGEVIRGGQGFRVSERKNKGKYLILMPRHVRDGAGVQVSDRDYYIDEIDNERVKKTVLLPGDILISLAGPRLIYRYTQDDPPCIAGQMFAIIRAKDNEYIKTYLETEDGAKLFHLQADRKSVGSAAQSLLFRDLRRILIPILPIDDLNRVSDKYIEETNNKDELEALRRELEIKKALNEQLQHTNQQLMSFMNNRMDKVDDRLTRLEEKIDQIIDLLKGLQSEIAVIKTLKTDEEQIIKFMEQKIDEAVDKLSQEDIDPYIEIAKASIDPNWFKLEMLSQIFLPNAELLFANISKIKDADPSPFIIQYCRTLENELLKKIFLPYMYDLKERGVIVEDAFAEDLQVNENGKPTNRNRNSYDFANTLKTLQKKDEPEWFFELGKMSFILIKMTSSRAENSPLFNDFKKFLLKSFDERFIDRSYYEKILNLAKDFRNKAAHPNVIKSSDALLGREAIKNILRSLLDLYKVSADNNK